MKDNLAVISAGSPGVGKTTLMRQKLQEASKGGCNYPYVCPDDVCLKGQIRTYVADVMASDGSFESREAAYTKWRPASNAATHILLANLIKDKYDFYFGTTCSSPMTYKFFDFLKEQGYRIKVIHVSATDDVRWGSIQERDKSFVQTTEEDVRDKGLMVPQRINDTFLRYADEIEFYYRSEVSAGVVLAATWIKNQDSTTSAVGELTIFNKEAYEGVKAVHNAATDALKKPELKWEAAVESVSNNKTIELLQPKLNSERIKHFFGSYGVEAMEIDSPSFPTSRIANLYSIHGARKVMRTLAVVDFFQPVAADLSAAHTEIMQGGSIGSTLVKHGWKVMKSSVYFGEMSLSTALMGRMDEKINRLGALHIYHLEVSRKDASAKSIPYCDIIELHSPQYLTVKWLKDLYPEEYKGNGSLNDEKVARVVDSLSELIRNFPPDKR